MHILFVCTGNTCRSPMAAALFQAIAKRRGIDAVAQSAGLSAKPGMRASENAIGVMQKRYGLDLSGHRAKPLTSELIDAADCIVCMTTAHLGDIQRRHPTEKAATLGVWAGQDQNVADPFGGGEDAYVLCALQLEGLIDSAIQKHFTDAGHIPSATP